MNVLYADLKSSNIDCIELVKPDRKKTETDCIVTFKHSGTYRYKRVPHRVVSNVLRCASVGRAFNKHIRNAYEFERVAG